MNKEIAKKWVKALRSGDYKQTKNRLRDANNGFCCLGVLCNLHAEVHPEIAAAQPRPDEYLYCTETLPFAVADWAGLNSKIGSAHYIKIGRQEYSTLAEANDKGVSFKEIAGWIEKHHDDL